MWVCAHVIPGLYWGVLINWCLKALLFCNCLVQAVLLILCSGFHDAYHRLGGLNSKICFLTMLEIRGLRSRYWRGCFFWPSLVYRSKMAALFSLCLHVLFPLCVCVPISSCEETSHTGLGLAVWPYFTLTTSLKALSPNLVTFWGTGGLAF